MKQDKMEDRILAYMLGECNAEESFEVERLCREDPIWQSEKIRFSQVLGLLEKSVSGPSDHFLPEKEQKLSMEQRDEIKSLLNQDTEQADTQKEQVMKTKNIIQKNSKIFYWAPLAAAAMAAIIAYWGNPESKENKDSSKPVSASAKSESQNLAHSPDVNSSKLDNAKPELVAGSLAYSDLALQEAIADSANQTLALRTVTETKEMERDNIESLPSGKDLTTRLGARDATVQEETVTSSLAAAFAITTTDKDAGNPTPGLTVPKKSDSEIVDEQQPMIHAEKASIHSNASLKEQSNWFSVVEKSEESFIFNQNGDSLGKIRVIESSAGKIQFERTNWPNKNRSFSLAPGIYEIRLSHKQSGTLIVKGTLTTLQEKGRYNFNISEAWELDKNEKRNALSIEDLSP